MTAFAVAFMFFCLVSAAALAVYLAVYGPHRALEERFEDLAVKMRAAQGALAQGAPSESFARSLFKWAAQRIPAPHPGTPQGEKLAQTLAQAGFIRSGAAHTFRIVQIFAAAGGGALGLPLGLVALSGVGRTFLSMAAGAAAGFLLPGYYLGIRARKRQAAIARQLSDALDLLIVCVEAGLGLQDAIRIVGTEGERQKQEIGVELSLVASAISAGASLGQALRSMTERTAVEDIKPLAATLIQSEQLGAQVGPALRASADALRTRRRLHAEEMAQKASVKILFPLVVFVLPAMIAVIVGPAIIQVIKTLSPA